MHVIKTYHIRKEGEGLAELLKKDSDPLALGISAFADSDIKGSASSRQPAEPSRR